MQVSVLLNSNRVVPSELVGIYLLPHITKHLLHLNASDPCSLVIGLEVVLASHRRMVKHHIMASFELSESVRLQSLFISHLRILGLKLVVRLVELVDQVLLLNVVTFIVILLTRGTANKELANEVDTSHLLISGRRLRDHDGIGLLYGELVIEVTHFVYRSNLLRQAVLGSLLTDL